MSAPTRATRRHMRPGERGVSHDGFGPQPDRKRAALRAVWSRSRGSASRWTASPPRGAPRLARRCGAPAHVAPGCMPSVRIVAPSAPRPGTAQSRSRTGRGPAGRCRRRHATARPRVERANKRGSPVRATCPDSPACSSTRSNPSSRSRRSPAASVRYSWGTSAPARSPVLVTVKVAPTLSPLLTCRSR